MCDDSGSQVCLKCLATLIVLAVSLISDLDHTPPLTLSLQKT
jgi:hypothetical protein